MDLTTPPPQIDEARLNELGTTLFRQWGTYVTDRKMLEERWLRNLRQVRKIYDPEVLALIPADRSKAYPGITQWMVRGTIARLMQMLFPQTEKNYGIKPSPLPDLSTEQVQEVLDHLVAAKGGDPAQVDLTDEEIEKAILAYAKGKAEQMELKIEDDLQSMEFITLARKVVKSAVTYNIGVLEGPMHEKVSARSWQKDTNTGKWTAVESEKLRPLYEFEPVWDHYFDMTAQSLDKQDGVYDRKIMRRADVQLLAARTDFMPDRITKYLNDNPSGNYKAQWWESVIKGEPKSGLAPVASKESRKFEALSYRGMVTGFDLRAAGVAVADADVGKSFHANCWMLDSVVIKLKLSPFAGQIPHHHYFVFEEDDLSIAGNGQPDVLRDSQMSACETARAALDNMSVIGPMVEVNTDLLTPGQDMAIKKHKTWWREGEGQAANMPAVRDINIESHLSELTALLNMFMGFAEKESGLPPPSVGDMSGGGSEALRTSKNASMFLGAAALPIRDTVRNYDSFTISVISALVAWNQKYDPNPTRDGDHDIIARGSTSLIAKEVLSGALNEFRASVTPDEVPHLNTRGMLIARMKVNDLPVDDLVVDEETANATIKSQQDQQQAAMQVQHDLVDAQVHEVFARALEHVAKAQTEGVTSGTAVLEALTAALAAGHKATADRTKNAVADFAAGHAAVAAHDANAIALKVANKPTAGAK